MSYSAVSQPVGNSYTFIWGGETGASNGVANAAYSVAAARGNGSLRGFDAVGSANLVLAIPASVQVPATLGILFDHKLRFCFSINALPTGTYNLAKDTSATAILLQLSPSGQVRLDTAAAWSVTALTPGVYYRADCRCRGYGPGVNDTIAFGAMNGRSKTTIDIYNATSNALVVSLQSGIQVDDTTSRAFLGSTFNGNGSYSPATISTTPFNFAHGAGWLTAQGFGLTTVSGLGGAFPSVRLNYTPGSISEVNGGEWKIAYVIDVGEFITGNLGYYVENGTILPFNEPFSDYKEFSGSLPWTSVQIGANTTDATARVFYDDIWCDFKLGNYVVGSDDFPQGTHVLPIIATAQGSQDDFTPTGAYASVGRLPGVANTLSANVVTAVTNARTTYRGTLRARNVYHVRPYTWLQTTVNGTQTVEVDGVFYPHAVTTSGGEVIDDVSYLSAPMTSDQFNAMEYGVKNTSGGLKLFNQMLEILADEAVINVAGTITPTGVLTRTIQRPVAGTQTAVGVPILFKSRIPNGVEGSLYAGLVEAISVPNVVPWTYTVSGGTLPGGLTLNANNGTISGLTPTRGVYTFTLRGTHSGGFIEETFIVEVFARKKLKLPNISIANTGAHHIVRSQQMVAALSANVPGNLLSTSQEIGDLPVSVLWANTANYALLAVRANVAQFWRDTSEFQAGPNITFTPNGQAIIIAADLSGAGSNGFGTVGVSGQANLVAQEANAVLTFVAGLGVVLTTNVASDGAIHLAVNATPLNVNSALNANNTAHAFGKLEADLNVNNAVTANTSNNSTNFAGQAQAFYLNVSNFATGTMNAALLPFAGTLANGIVSNTTQTFGGVKTFNANTEFSGYVNVATTLHVTGNSQLGNTNVTGWLNVSSTLAVAGLSTLTGNATLSGFANIAQTLNVAGITQLTGNTTLSGFANIGTTIQVASAALFNGLVTANAGLTVNGAVAFDNTVSANGTVGTLGYVFTSAGAGANAYWAPTGSTTTNSYGTVEVSGQANLVATTGNSIFTIVAGNGILLTTNVSSDGALHIAVNGAIGAAGSGSGAWKFITSATASGAQVDFPGLGAYNEILVVLRLVTLDGGGVRILRVSTDNGVSFLGATGDYKTLDSTGTETNAFTYIPFHQSATTAARSAWMIIRNFNVATYPKIAEVLVLSGGNNPCTIIPTTSALNAIRIFDTNADNFTGGTIYVFGR
jgi:hypothetical protein